MERIKTSSTEQATFLLARGHRIVGTARSGRELTYHFNDTPEARADMDSLRFGDDDLVSAKALFTARRRCIGLVFDREEQS